MAMNFPDAPTAGQSFTSGGTTWVWTVPPNAWKATAGPAGGVASFLPLTGGVLASPGNLTVRGGILGGAAGTMPAAGSMLLNGNTGAPTAVFTPAPNLYIVGPDSSATRLVLDAYNGTPAIFTRRARGTAAAPTAVQTGDLLLYMQGTGYAATTWGTSVPQISMGASENWTAGANGSSIALWTTPVGTTTAVSSLTLNGNTATFSGTVSTGSSVTVGNVLTVNGQAVMQQGLSVGGLQTGNAGGAFQIQADLIITGGNATKATGSTWINPSSRDIKNDIQPYDKGLQAVLALKPSTYRFQRGLGLPEGRHIGLVHDETAHMPEMHTKAVLGGTPDKPGREVDALDCSAITFALVNAVRELKAEIDALKGKRATRPS